ncbi:MAG: tRNA (adenosine(37)-N6)-dimethylallyltransferase MiaA [Bacteroidales bacterium]
MKNLLIVVTGPTAIGKTTVAIQLAKTFDAEIISADSRQFYKELRIGVAAPTEEELCQARHHFIGHISISDHYNVSKFENEVIEFLNTYYKKKQVAVMVGGSGLYIDAVCKGIDELPDPDNELRKTLKRKMNNEGIEASLLRLKELDPDYFNIVDRKNPNRILRALEVCLTTGKTYTSLRNNQSKKRGFEILKIGLNRPRNELFQIIHNRVDQMIETGLIKEVEGLKECKNFNSLNTVGYKEIFNYLDNEWSLDLAIEKIKTNTRRYAKRQLTWFKRDDTVEWFHPEDIESIVEHLRNKKFFQINNNF